MSESRQGDNQYLAERNINLEIARRILTEENDRLSPGLQLAVSVLWDEVRRLRDQLRDTP